MTHTLTLIADHKGYTKPKAIGDEYVVIADLDIADLGVVGAPTGLTGTFDSTANTLAITAGSNAGRITEGMEITIAGAADSGNNTAVTVLKKTGVSATPTFTLSAVAADETGDTGLSLTPATREVVLASELGLKTIHAVEIIGQESKTVRFTAHLNASTGLYTTNTSEPFYFELEAVTASSGAEVALGVDVGRVRVRVHGSL